MFAATRSSAPCPFGLMASQGVPGQISSFLRYNPHIRSPRRGTLRAPSVHEDVSAFTKPSVPKVRSIIGTHLLNARGRSRSANSSTCSQTSLFKISARGAREVQVLAHGSLSSSCRCICSLASISGSFLSSSDLPRRRPCAKMLVLYETSLGFCLFKLTDDAKLESKDKEF